MDDLPRRRGSLVAVEKHQPRAGHGEGKPKECGDEKQGGEMVKSTALTT